MLTESNQHSTSLDEGSAAGVTIIVPLFNEVENLPELVRHLDGLGPEQIIFVDGGSDDGSWEWLQAKQAARSVQAGRGRATQMNAGAALANFRTLLFLHADTQLPKCALSELDKGVWGRFDVRFNQHSQPVTRTLRLVAKMMNLRSRISHVCTGDQAIFVQRALFVRVGGFDSIPIMEDIALSKKLRKVGAPYCSRLTVRTSARRWQEGGVWRTIGLMWGLRLAYVLGVSPERLNKIYRHVR